MALTALLTAARLFAQDDHPDHSDMSGGGMVDMNPVAMYLMNLASGTSVNPAAWPMPMLTTHYGS